MRIILNNLDSSYELIIKIMTHGYLNLRVNMIKIIYGKRE